MPHAFPVKRATKRAIVHIDGDAFFAACEQALHPEYRGKPVVTGADRGMAIAVSYEAKALGINRGMLIHEIRKRWPQVIISRSDYTSYKLFAQHMYNIMYRYSNDVEEYSIDEGFVDITGLRGPLHKSYPAIAYDMKQAIQNELHISVSVGLSVNKLLAKIASTSNKPNGFTVIAKSSITEFLPHIPIAAVWGIGRNTTAYLEKFRIHTAADLAEKSEIWIKQHGNKHLQELWHELHGRSVLPLTIGPKQTYQSIQKSETFRPPSKDPNVVFSQLSRHVEAALAKLRKHNLACLNFSLFLKTQEFRYHGISAHLNRATAYPNDVMPIIKQLFPKIFKPNTLYRATGITVHTLQPLDTIQLDLFEEPLMLERYEKMYASVDAINGKHGRNTLILGSSLIADNMIN